MSDIEPDIPERCDGCGKEIASGYLVPTGEESDRGYPIVWLICQDCRERTVAAS